MGKFDAAVEKYRELIKETHDYIWANPETGYREIKTSAYMEEAFEKLGYDIVRAGDIPGFYTVLDTGREGPEVLVLAELDSLICPEHPEADPETGAVHCCGHHAQCAALVGLAAALKEPGVLDSLSGRIRLCTVPAEELIEIEYRKELMKEGKIRYFGGKTEFLYRGYFDGVDMAFMVHTTSANDKFVIGKGSVGCIAKRVVYKGVSAHAGSFPWNGCNALYAATLGLQAINSVRETFKEQDIIRVHPIITQGGGAVNAIPDNVVLESYVRGSNFEAIREANNRVNRALCGAALSLGANIDIEDAPGYAPLLNDEGMRKLAYDAALNFPEVGIFVKEAVGSGCTDLGDICSLIPVIHPNVPGAEGRVHSANYRIKDIDLACVTSAKWQLEMLYLLLSGGASRAKEIIKEHKAPFKSKEEYFSYIDAFNSDGDRITYTDGAANVRL